MKLVVFCKIKLFSLGLVAILKNIALVKSLKLTDNLEPFKNTTEKTTLIIVLEEGTNDLINNIEEISKNSSVNLLIIDLIGSNNLMKKLISYSVKGYLLSTSSLEDVEFALNKINLNEKYYQSSVLELLLKMETDKNNKTNHSLSNLSKRELEIIKEISLGNSNLEISYNLNISEHTVKKHISNIFQKTNCTDRVQLALLSQKEII